LLRDEGAISTGGRHTEITRSDATIEAFGTGSPEAGWRLSMTRAREIPLDTPELRAAVAQGVGHEGSFADQCRRRNRSADRGRSVAHLGIQADQT